MLWRKLLRLSMACFVWFSISGGSAPHREIVDG
jgi:hypothetical protein